MSELPFPQSTLKEQSEQEDSDLVQKCEDWARDQTKKMKRTRYFLEGVEYSDQHIAIALPSNFDTTTSRNMSLDEAKDMLKTRYEMFTTQTIKADASTFVTQDLYVVFSRF